MLLKAGSSDGKAEDVEAATGQGTVVLRQSRTILTMATGHKGCSGMGDPRSVGFGGTSPPHMPPDTCHNANAGAVLAGRFSLEELRERRLQQRSVLDHRQRKSRRQRLSEQPSALRPLHEDKDVARRLTKKNISANTSALQASITQGPPTISRPSRQIRSEWHPNDDCKSVQRKSLR